MHCNQYKCVFISFNIEYRKLILKERRIHERKTDATTQAAGSVQADIALVCGTATDKVSLTKQLQSFQHQIRNRHLTQTQN